MEYIYAGVTFVAEPATEGYVVSIKEVRGPLIKNLVERDAWVVAMHFNDHMPMLLDKDSYPIPITKEQVMAAIEEIRKPDIEVEKPKGTTLEIQSGKLGHTPKL